MSGGQFLRLVVCGSVLIIISGMLGGERGNRRARKDLAEQGYICPACGVGVSFPPGRVEANDEEILCSHSFHEKNLPYYQLRLKSTKTLEEQAMKEHMSPKMEKKNPEEE